MSILAIQKFWKHGQKAQLAKRAGISRQYLNDILSCRKRALPELAVKLERAAAEMSITIEAKDFMFPSNASMWVFNTPEARIRKRLAREKMLENPRLIDQFAETALRVCTGQELRSSNGWKKRGEKVINKIANRVFELLLWDREADRQVRAVTHPEEPVPPVRVERVRCFYI